MAKLFQEPRNTFFWEDIQTWAIRSQYNELLNRVLTAYANQYSSPLPTFLNKNYCLTISACNGSVIYKDALREANDFSKTKAITEAERNFIEKQDAVGNARLDLQMAEANLVSISSSNKANSRAREIAEQDLKRKEDAVQEAEIALKRARYEGCYDPGPTDYFVKPVFLYERVTSIPADQLPLTLDFSYITNGLTVGALLWLYYYERMGIFKILGALMDDYNYRGKYTISGCRFDDKGIAIAYSNLMDMICTLHRLGISSNLRDRVCTYQRVLGVTIENNLGIESEQNRGFMQAFNKLIDYMLEYYKTKQLAQAIQAQTGNILPRSSVATQTSIRDTMNVLKQQFEPFQYGRNQINTFIGLATVHATICLVNMLKAEIGIPSQYDKPEEFIPAAYDILVAKRPITLNESNRFIVYDNCASYGYRLLTDIETSDLTQLTTIATGSTLDIWLNDVEGLVEGYRNAYSTVPERATAMVQPY
ncbi:hypothetical protein [Spirosoma panaciterrae]|uniref:hypothetical protein n=1 Tax=Spirosoma panaciterrae TaxID=496058 RepID=UPI000373C768|nr:hypothetical protein [Spirosoma panaciterrae]